MADRDQQPAHGAWRVLRRERLVDDRWLRVDREDVALPDGHRIDGYYVVHQPDFAIVFAVTDDRQVILVRQYKHGIGRPVLELPAGYLEAGDASPEAAMRRELGEETGYQAAEIRRIGRMVSNPTRSPDLGHVFLATGCWPAGAQRLDPAERIEVVRVPLDAVAALVRAGEIVVQSSVAAIFLGLEALRAGEGTSPVGTLLAAPD